LSGKSTLARWSNPSNVRLLYLARGIRGFGDGFATIILPAYPDAIGYDPVQIGIVLSGSLLGTAVCAALPIRSGHTRFLAPGLGPVRAAMPRACGTPAQHPP
jgi:hypothetical protein